MTPQSEESLFEAAAALTSAAQRASFLDQACEGKPELRGRLEALLAAHEETGGMLGSGEGETDLGPVTQADPGVGAQGIGKVIGNYKLLEKIGEGGCGVVYLAEQTEPVRRRVALKVIRPGMDSKEIIARFEAERQALALMDHPNIARVYDGGVSEGGRPYFVMELVKGLPITQFCDERNISIAERLGLFINVCAAVQHAHQKGVIHRDIKPSNVMVAEQEDRPVPKVIDFGVAKAIQQDLTDKTLFTKFGQFIGTPTYMSPEQAVAGGQDIDTRADIYSLGVLLYELLTGHTPFDQRDLLEAGFAEMHRVIATEDPAKPSTRLSTLDGGELADRAKHRGTLPSRLRSLLRGDLDWIVMRALEKERARRYETVNGLAADIGRFLRDEPVEAGPPRFGYKVKKFVRRNRLVVAATGGLVAILLGGIVAFLMIREERAREKARDLHTAFFDCRIERLGLSLLKLDPYIPRVEAELRQIAGDQSRGESDRARARLALLREDPTQMSHIMDWLMRCPPLQLEVYVSLMSEHHDELREFAWSTILDGGDSEPERLHAAAVCAQLDPSDLRWKKIGPDVAGCLVKVGADELHGWISLLQPVAIVLTSTLRDIYNDRTSFADGGRAAVALAKLQLDDSVALVKSASPDRMVALIELLSSELVGAEAVLSEELNAPPTYGDHEAALERARLCIGLLMLGHPERALAALEHSPDPEIRTALVHSFADYHVAPQQLFALLEPSMNPGTVSGILIALGDYSSEMLPQSLRLEMQPQIERLYAETPDAGVHSSADWLLRQWGLDGNLAKIDRQLATRIPRDGRNWFLDSASGFTFAILPSPIEFRMGTPQSEVSRYKSLGAPFDESQHDERLERRVAIAVKEVTVAQFHQFASVHLTEIAPSQGDGAQVVNRHASRLQLRPECSIPWVSLKEAMVFCWWLTDKEGLEQCYDYDPQKPFSENNPSTLDGYLEKNGYRLPTEAEWEAACRGGTSGQRYFGNNDRFLPKYCWHLVLNNPDPTPFSRPPGELRPNAYGLFDSLGNVSEWCQDEYSPSYRSHPSGISREVRDVPRPIAKVPAGGPRTLPAEEEEPEDVGGCFGEIAPGIGQYGAPSACGPEGWAVFKWVGDHFVLEDSSNCAAGFSPPAPPQLTDREKEQVRTYNEFRMVVCCVPDGPDGHVFRGGSFNDPPTDMRAAKRFRSPFTDAPSTSFRIARTIRSN